MKKIITVAVVTLFAINVNAQTPAKKTTPVKKPATTTKSVAKPAIKPAVKAKVFNSNLDSASYALGINVASSFKSGGMNTLNYELFNKGLRDVFAKANPLLTDAQCQQAVNSLFASFSKVREAEEMKKFEPQIKVGNDFLAANKIKPGIKTTASGLQYEILTQGTGAKPASAAANVTVHYKGTLLNGFEFDSSYKRNEPTSFGLNQVISGWTEGVQLMNEGSKYRFFVPYNLAYGSRDGGQIPPYSTLIFEVELIKVN
jgi:FKBP-type peptidyl-prolyl cis-trans isomerase